MSTIIAPTFCRKLKSSHEKEQSNEYIPNGTTVTCPPTTRPPTTCQLTTRPIYQLVRRQLVLFYNIGRAVGGRVVAFITLGELSADELSADKLSAGELPLYLPNTLYTRGFEPTIFCSWVGKYGYDLTTNIWCAFLETLCVYKTWDWILNVKSSSSLPESKVMGSIFCCLQVRQGPGPSNTWSLGRSESGQSLESGFPEDKSLQMQTVEAVRRQHWPSQQQSKMSWTDVGRGGLLKVKNWPIALQEQQTGH
jgi:hypothetical protein